MLFLSQLDYEARRAIWRRHESGEFSEEQAFQKALEIDPNDHIGMIGLGRLRQEGGDLAAAEEYFWRAVRAHPCASSPYMALAGALQLRPESDALSIAIGELGLSKYVADEDAPLEKLDFQKAGFDEKLGKKFAKLPASTQIGLVAEAMRANRDNEPESVTAVMRPLRLIQDLQNEGLLERQTVDEIIGQGQPIVPLLVGVLRDWARDLLDEEDDSMMESALALLGEIGTSAEIPHILEFICLEHQGASGCAAWALGRIIERHTEAAAQLLESIAPGLGVGERLSVAEQVLRYPAIDAGGRLLQKFAENIETWARADLDVFLPALISAMIAARGSGGIGMCRDTLLRHGRLLSRNARRDCEALLAAFSESEVPPLPVKPVTFDVYDICAGDVPWEDIEQDLDEELEEDLEEMEKEEYTPKLDPVRRTNNIGRNDPCWCNSGKKYKKCHLESDERERQPLRLEPVAPREKNEFESLRKRLGEYLHQVIPEREALRAAEEFMGDPPPDVADRSILLIDWLLHDWVSSRLGRTVMQQFLIQRGSRLTDREHEMVDAWSRSYVGLYEVQETKPRVGLTLKELSSSADGSGEAFFVHDVNLSTRLVRWDGLLARVVPGERGTELAGIGLTVPRGNIGTLREWMDRDRAEIGLDWPEYLKQNWPRIRRQSYAIARNRMDSIRLANSDGEELLISKAVYKVLDEPAALTGLRSCPEFETETSGATESNGAEGESFIWLNEGKTVLGNIAIGSDQLVLECNSRQRLERGKALLAELAGTSLQHLRDEFTTQKELLNRAKTGHGKDSSASAKAADAVPKEVSDEIVARYLEDHYKKWPDMKLPALQGKTPREAARTPKGRKQLNALLRDLENAEDRKRLAGDLSYDVGKLRAELGL